MQTVSFKIAGKPEFLGVIRLFISGLLRRLDYDYEKVEDMKIAIGEICGWCLQQDKHAGPLLITAQIKDRQVGIEIRKENFNFQMDELRKDDLAWSLIQSLVDELYSYSQTLKLVINKTPAC
jgi:serine/threonine-protein kinase RsbW